MARPVRHRGKWRIRWIDENGRRQSEVYDSFNDAQAKLREHQHHVHEIRLGLRSPTPPRKTFDDVAEYWLTRRAPNKRSRASDESIIRVHLRPFFGGMPLNRVASLEQVDSFAASKAQLHPNTLHHLLTLLISLLRLAVELGWLRQLPKVKKPRIRLFTKDFHYLRTAEEITRFLNAARDDGELPFILYATAVFTGMRQGELAALRWEDVNLARRLIAVQRSFDGPTKSGDVRYVPVLDALLPLLREWKARCPGRLVFPNRDGRMFAKSARIFQESFHAVLERAGFSQVERHGKLRSYIRFHDLRHTFASHWMMNGGDLFKLQNILGHKSSIMTMRYAHLAPAAFAADYDRFGQVSAVGNGVVVAFPRARPAT